jgi:hypothetical protein
MKKVITIMFITLFVIKPSFAEEINITPDDIKESDNFGNAVSIFGNYAIVGACEDDTRGTNAGAAYIFKRQDNIWTRKQKIFAREVGDYAGFGNAVSIYGDYIIVGSKWADHDSNSSAGAIYIYKRVMAMQL